MKVDVSWIKKYISGQNIALMQWKVVAKAIKYIYKFYAPSAV